MCQWIRLGRAWKTKEALRVMSLLTEDGVRARTVPREFGSPIGLLRLERMNPEAVWPIFVKAKQLEKALSVLKKTIL